MAGGGDGGDSESFLMSKGGGGVVFQGETILNVPKQIVLMIAQLCEYTKKIFFDWYSLKG